jgi:hypothetical protein
VVSSEYQSGLESEHNAYWYRVKGGRNHTFLTIFSANFGTSIPPSPASVDRLTSIPAAAAASAPSESIGSPPLALDERVEDKLLSADNGWIWIPSVPVPLPAAAGVVDADTEEGGCSDRSR